MKRDSNRAFDSFYADHYDLLQGHRDFEGEIAGLDKRFSDYNHNNYKGLDIGCGTGLHAIGLGRLGYSMVGVDRSPEMIRVALSKKSPVTFQCSSLREFSENEFDFAFSMGQVVNYLEDFEGLSQFFGDVFSLLNKEGVYYFECWNPISLNRSPPQPLTRTYETDDYKIIRPVQPHYDPLAQELELHYEIQKINKTGKVLEEVRSSHHLKIFTPLELEYYLKLSGFRKIQIDRAISEKEAFTPESRFLSFFCRK